MFTLNFDNITSMLPRKSAGGVYQKLYNTAAWKDI